MHQKFKTDIQIKFEKVLNPNLMSPQTIKN